MEEISGPTVPPDHPDRRLFCQEALEQAFKALSEQAEAAGWEPQEIAVAITDLADCHMLWVSANWETEHEIGEALKAVANGNGMT